MISEILFEGWQNGIAKVKIEGCYKGYPFQFNHHLPTAEWDKPRGKHYWLGEKLDLDKEPELKRGIISFMQIFKSNGWRHVVALALRNRCNQIRPREGRDDFEYPIYLYVHVSPVSHRVHVAMHLHRWAANGGERSRHIINEYDFTGNLLKSQPKAYNDAPESWHKIGSQVAIAFLMASERFAEVE